MPKLKPADYIEEARRLACEKDGKVQKVAKKARRTQKVIGESPETVALFAKANRLGQEAAVLRWLATYVESKEA